MEGSAKFIFEFVDQWDRIETSNRVGLYSVECCENGKKSALYIKKNYQEANQ